LSVEQQHVEWVLLGVCLCDGLDVGLFGGDVVI